MDQQKKQRLRKIFKAYLREELHPEEKQIIENWFDQDYADKRRLEQIDESMGKSAFREILAKTAPAPVTLPKAVSPIKAVMKYAAAAIILLGAVSIYLYEQKDRSVHLTNTIPQLAIEDTLITQPGQRVKVTLPDSTTIYVHGNTKIRYAAQLNTAAERKVYLDQGEAFFDVTHRKEQPFVVYTAAGKNKVLGTSFNIKLEGGDRSYHLSVNTGAVEFTSGRDSSIRQIIRKGNHLIFHPEQQLLSVEKGEVGNFSSWKDNIFILNGDNWHDVKQKLENWFGVQVHVPRHLANTQFFTATFEEATLKKVLKGLQQINTFTYKIDGKEVYIE
ncbi:FecR family protein [Sphingobacterium deserti]|uniref:Anti-FecI sigma factor, FecR n=1 Tax=Sphingobacterium deserti TaxID=1229276 RepID=A0A0B8T0X9_9SPHI|nr:FecR domain-containing protein [Sphingobacterium deserti]KGE14467.1 anti-FecI sigma factor, FecR [Sphingobacterium deserti]